MQMWRKRAVSIVMSSVLGLGAAIPALVAESVAVPHAAKAASGSDSGSTAQTVSDELTLKLIGRYKAPEGATAAEIVTYNKFNGKAYVINGAAKSLDILDLSTLQSPVGEGYQSLDIETRITLPSLGLNDDTVTDGTYSYRYDMTSVAVSPTGEYVVLAIPYAKKFYNADLTKEKTVEHYKGKIVLLSKNGELLNQFEAGYLPDMITFTPDGTKILTANEGEPNFDYSIDPEGSITIVDLSAGAAGAVAVQVSLDLPDSLFDANVRVFPKGHAAASSTERAQDLEPEYIAVDPGSNYAYVTLQENNSIAVLNLRTKAVERVSGLGLKDHSLAGNELDTSDKDDIKIGKAPVLGMYMPDGMTLFQSNGKTYLVTANEGDAREYINDAVNPIQGYAEEVSVKDIAAKIKLDRSKYKGYSDEEWSQLQADLPTLMKKDGRLGNLTVTSSVYTVTGATYYDALYTFGGRSFTIWDASNIAAGPVFDSGDDFEQTIAARLPNYFNVSNDKTSKDARSKSKGPEPEDAKIGVIGGKTYAFIGLERVGGIMAYNVTNPAQATFAGYVNSRDFSTAVGGDSGPEGLNFVAAEYSPTGKPLLLAGNETSGTVAVYEITSNVSDAGTFPLTIIHTNDTHANIDSAGSPDNIARRVTAIKQARAQAANSILVDSGDVFSGTLYFNKYEGQADLAFMNMVQYDAMTFGNHEFDRGTGVLANFVKNAYFPFVSANIDFSANNDLKGYAVNEIGRPGSAGGIYPAIVKEIGGQKVGIFGLTTEDTPSLSSPGDTVKFSDAATKAQETVAALKDQGINKIIALSHLGYDEDVELAKKVEDIDVIVGGHSHTLLKTPYADNSHANPTIIVQVNEKAENLGNVKVEFDAEGKLVSWAENLIGINAQASGKYVLAADPEALQLLNTAYKPAVVAEKSIVVGKSDIDLYGAVAANGNPRTVRTKETAIANLVVDGMLDEAVSAGTGAVMALQNGGGIRTNILKGDITRGGVIEILPYSNDLVVLELTGREIWDGLENGVSAAPAEYGGFPHVAGMKYVYDSSRPSKQRVISVSVKTSTGYEPLKLDQKYKLATNIFTAKGGDNYTSFAQAFNEGRVDYMYSPGYPYKADFEVFIQYLNKLGGTLEAANTGVDGRIVDLKGPKWPDQAKLTASDITSSSVKLAWSPAADDAGVAEYRIYNGSAQLGTVSGSVYTTVGNAVYYTYSANGLSASTAYTFKVEAADGAGTATVNGPSVTVTTLSGSSDSNDPGTVTPGAGAGTPAAPDTGVKLEPVAVSGGVELKPVAKDLKTEQAADGTPITSLALSAESLTKALETAGAGKTVITLPPVEGTVKVALPASSLAGKTQGTIQVRTADKSYDLPLAVVNPSELASALGAAVGEVSINIVIGEVAGSAKATVESAAAKNGAALLTDAVSFTVTAQANGKSVEINHFGTTYVARTLILDSIVDPAAATAVVFDPATGGMSFVPSVFHAAGGKTVVTIKRNSNSIYGVVKPAAASFADLSGHWSRQDVELLAAKLVIDGQAPGRFAPDAQVKRGEFASLLVRALGLAPDASAVSGVKDLQGSEWYAGALGAAKKAGLMDGFEDGTLRGEANITRAEMAVMMSRALKAAGKAAPSGAHPAFADQGQIPSWAADAISASAAAGLVEGTSGNRFAPAAQATRAEAAAMLKRLLKYAEFIN